MSKSKSRRIRRRGGKRRGTKKWTTAIDAGQHAYVKTGSLSSAKKALRLQALSNARKLFGSI